MKIITLISGGDVGGAKTHVLSLLAGLGRTEEIQLVCFMEGAFAQEARELGIPTLVMSGGLRGVCTQLESLIRQRKFEIIHCHGSRANMMGALLRRRCQVPVVTTVHSDYRLDYLGRPLHRLTYGSINTVALRMLDYHIGVSDPMAELLISRGFDPLTMFSIYNGVDFKPVRPSMDRKTWFASIGLDAPEDAVVFGIAARISPVKDMATLVRAFAKCAAECPNARLVIAGDGESADEIRALAAELCPAGSVVFAGWVKDVDSFYNAIDVNTLTSLSETFPYALTEGARLHCATIASNVGGVPILIDHGVCGLLFEPQDADTLARHMIRLVRDPELRLRLADRLYEKAKAEYSVDVTVEHQKEIYRAILRREARKQKGGRDGVLICGAYGRGNAGDDAILEAIISQLHAIDPDLPLHVLTRTPRATSVRYRIGSVYTFNSPKYRRLMKKSKLYINGGGSLIQDVTSSRSLFYYLTSIRTAHTLGNRVLMYGCGIGPVTKPHDRRSAAKVLNRDVDMITLRESGSALELERLGVTGPEIRITADPALLLQSAPAGKLESFLLREGLDPAKKHILFALRPWPGFEKLVPVFAACAQRLFDEKGLIPVFFALEPERDLAAARSVTAALHCPSHVIAAPEDGGLIIGLMGAMEAVVSMRLHPLVFASGQGVPLIGIAYDPKVRSFLEYIGEQQIFDLADLTGQALDRALDQVLGTRADAAARADRLRGLAEENGRAAAELLSR